MPLNNIHDLFELKLLGVLAAEKRILDMLDEAASESKEPKVRDAFKAHREETRGQIERIEQVFASLQRRSRNVDAPVVEGLFEEKRRFIGEDPTPEMIDVFNVSAGVKTEHLEIAAYEDLLALVGQMDANDMVAPLRKNLEEEQATLEKLMAFAKDGTLATSTQAKPQQGPVARR